MEKPHAPIFQEALRRSGTEAADVVHVGDQITSDVQGAANVGIRPVLLDRDGNHNGFSGVPEDRVVDGAAVAADGALGRGEAVVLRRGLLPVAVCLSFMA